jgi:hypothetical protein
MAHKELKWILAFLVFAILRFWQRLISFVPLHYLPVPTARCFLIGGASSRETV